MRDAHIDLYKKTLRAGYRSIEIEVWDGADAMDDIKQPDPGVLNEPLSSSIRPAVKRLAVPFDESEDPPISKAPNTILSMADKPVSRKMPVVGRNLGFSETFSFRDACVLIRDSAFFNNNMPIIVNFTVHAGVDQQQTMIDIMKVEWHGLLLDEPIDGCDPKLKLPRLENLQNKILTSFNASEPAHNRIYRDLTGTLHYEALERPPAFVERPSFDELRSNFLIQPLESLNVYLRSETFEGFESRQSKTPIHIFSWQENALVELISSSPADLLEHSKHQLCHVYPDPATADYSNLDPSRCWKYGVQMAAISHLNVDEGLMVNSGIFDDEEGWVSKPVGYGSTNEDISNIVDIPTMRITRFSILVFRDQCFQLMTKDGTGEQAKDLSPFFKVTMCSRGDNYEFASETQVVKDDDSEAFGYRVTSSAIAGIIPELTAIM